MYVNTDLSTSTDDETQTVKVTEINAKMTGQSNKHMNNKKSNTSIMSTILGIGLPLADSCADDELGYVWGQAPVLHRTVYTPRRGDKCELAA